MERELDVLAFAAHPDDVELCAGGTMCKLAAQGRRTGIVDLTRGELGTRGAPEVRAREAERAAEIMKLAVRENLGIPDGLIQSTRDNQLKIMQCIRRYRPHIVLVNAPRCRHPDHGEGSKLTLDSIYYAGLRKIETRVDGIVQEPWRPNHVLHYMQALPFEPTLVVDVSDVWNERVQALQAFESQFWTPGRPEPGAEAETFVSGEAFFKFVESRARTFGYRIGAQYGEPFLYYQGPFGTDDLFSTLAKQRIY